MLQLRKKSRKYWNKNNLRRNYCTAANLLELGFVAIFLVNANVPWNSGDICWAAPNDIRSTFIDFTTDLGASLWRRLPASIGLTRESLLWSRFFVAPCAAHISYSAWFNRSNAWRGFLYIIYNWETVCWDGYTLNLCWITSWLALRLRWLPSTIDTYIRFISDQEMIVNALVSDTNKIVHNFAICNFFICIILIICITINGNNVRTAGTCSGCWRKCSLGTEWIYHQWRWWPSHWTLLFVPTA